MAHRFRGGRKRERIMVKYSFSRFKNTVADPIIIDFDDSVEEVHSEQPPLHEAADLVIDLGGEDEPQKRESLPVTISDTSSNEGVEVLMKELSMADNKKQHTDARAEEFRMGFKKNAEGADRLEHVAN